MNQKWLKISNQNYLGNLNILIQFFVVEMFLIFNKLLKY